MFKTKSIITIIAVTFLMNVCNSYSQENLSSSSSENMMKESVKDLNPKSKLFKLHNSVATSYDNVTNIEFELGVEANVLLTVCNSKGEILETLVNDLIDAGDYNVHYKSSEKIISGDLTYKLEVKGISGIKNVFAVK